MLYVLRMTIPNLFLHAQKTLRTNGKTKTKDLGTSTMISMEKEDSLQNLFDVANSSELYDEDSLEIIELNSVESDNRNLNVDLRSPSPPKCSVSRHSRLPKMDELKDVVESMINKSDCVGLCVDNVRVPPRNEVCIDSSNDRRKFQEVLYSDLRPEKLLIKSSYLELPSSSISPCNDSSLATPRLLLLEDIFGFDRYGRGIVEENLPGIQYAYGNKEENSKNIAALWSYLENIKLINKLCSEDDDQKIMKAKGATNPTGPRHERETAEDYLENVYSQKYLYESNQENLIKNGKSNQKKSNKQRRNLKFGSYAIDSVNEKNLPRLLRYAWKSKVDKVKQYLSHTCAYEKINRMDDKGRTALHFAASWRDVDTVKELLKVPNINVNIRDADFKTPLFKAVESGDLATVVELVKAGANIQKSSNDGRNALEYALNDHGDDYFEIVKFLHKNDVMQANRRRDGQMSYLHVACVANLDVNVTKVIQELINQGEFVDATEGDGRTPLILAVQTNRAELVQLLLDNSADPKHMDIHSKSAIHYAQESSQCYRLLHKHLQNFQKTRQEIKIADGSKKRSFDVLTSHLYNEYNQSKINTRYNLC